jgi:GNAT superfamily N-acetyltransferase
VPGNTARGVGYTRLERLEKAKLKIMGPVIVSELRHGDRDFVAALALEAFAEYSRNAPRTVLEMLNGQDAMARVARCESQPVGFAVVKLPRDRGSAWLNAIAVHPSWRGTGVAQRLLAGVEHPAALRGFWEMKLNTAQYNLAALDLFLKCGYAICNRHRHFYSRGQDAVEMRKSLSASA